MRSATLHPARFFSHLRTAALFLTLTLAAGTCHADTIASLLGNFTVNQYTELSVANERIEVRHAIVFGQLPALRELHVADADGDGVTSQSERDAYAGRLAEAVARQFKLTVDGVDVVLLPKHAMTSLPSEQAGFSLRVDLDFAGELPPGGAQRSLAFANDNYAGRFGWREIVVKPMRGVAVFDTDAFSNSITAGLTESVQAMPASGPLGERAITLRFTADAMPAGARPLAPRPGTMDMAASASNTSSAEATAWVGRATRRIVDLISARDVPLPIALLALVAAAVLGAFHALSPGHGKTVVGAYLVGSRGTPAHAVFLGATVTVTHTIGVFVLGFATLLASSFIVPERLLPMLSFVSGAVVLLIGAVLLVQRWRAARVWARPRYKPLAPAAAKTLMAPWRARANAGVQGLAFAHAHLHDHRHGALVHSHGGSVHTHLPPGAAGEKVTWRSLLALGVSGGLVPCPSAMVLLLAAIALNKTGYGLLLVLAFSIGLAGTLTIVGLAFLHARERLRSMRVHPRWRHWLPVASAGVITAVGIAMCCGAFVSVPL